MSWFEHTNGYAYRGMRQKSSHRQIPERPTIYHVWDGAKWVEQPGAQMPTDRQRLEAVESVLYGSDEVALTKEASDIKALLETCGKHYGGS